jgi:DNA repair exonuclease SbcCD ATPase subunit
MSEIRDEELFSRANLYQRHLYSRGGMGHRRTSSNNLDKIKGLQFSGHRRTHSGTEFEAKQVSIVSPHAEQLSKPPITPVNDTLKQNSKQSSVSLNRNKKKNGFMGMLTAAIEYFDNEPTVAGNEISCLKAEISKLNARQDEMEQSNQYLLTEYSKLRVTLEEQNALRQRYDNYLTQLNSQAVDLEVALKNTRQLLKLEREKNRKLRAKLSNTASRRDSLENSSLSDKEQLDTYEESSQALNTFQEKEMRRLQERLAGVREEMISPKTRYPVNMSVQSLNSTPVIRHIRTPSGKIR